MIGNSPANNIHKPLHSKVNSNFTRQYIRENTPIFASIEGVPKALYDRVTLKDMRKLIWEKYIIAQRMDVRLRKMTKDMSGYTYEQPMPPKINCRILVTNVTNPLNSTDRENITIPMTIEPL